MKQRNKETIKIKKRWEEKWGKKWTWASYGGPPESPCQFLECHLALFIWDDILG